MTGAPTRRQLTVQGWLLTVLSVAGAFILVGAVVAALQMGRTDRVARDLNEVIHPAQVAAYQLQTALRDQARAVRTYQMTADPRFLTTYFEGQLAEDAAAADIRSLVGNHAQLVADLDTIENATAEWRSNYVEPLLETVVPGRPPPITPATVEQGNTEFDRIRALFETQSTHLTEVREDRIADRRDAQSWRDAVLVAILMTLVAMAVVLTLLVRNAVTRPLGALAAACRRVTKGNFGEQIAVQGPADIQAIASDVDDMRHRILDELDVSRSARTALSRQTEVLDAQASELRRSNAELEQFAYVVSHDLQEPLRKVASFCRLLAQRYGDQLDERAHEYIEFAVDGATRMQVLIDDLLTFARVGQLTRSQAELDMGATVDGAVHNLATAIEEAGARIVRPAHALPTLPGDPTLLTMLWQNLIGNAVKFGAPDRPPVVLIECVPDSAGGWEFAVTDNGIGIGPEYVDQVFVIFQRLHSRDAYPGTGVGLALCKKIVEYHGGSIWIDTSYTGGTRVCFTLPGSVEST